MLATEEPVGLKFDMLEGEELLLITVIDQDHQPCGYIKYTKEQALQVASIIIRKINTVH